MVKNSGFSLLPMVTFLAISGTCISGVSLLVKDITNAVFPKHELELYRLNQAVEMADNNGIELKCKDSYSLMMSLHSANTKLPETFKFDTTQIDTSRSRLFEVTEECRFTVSS